MYGIVLLLSVLELRHLAMLRSVVRSLSTSVPGLSAWLGAALMYEECRRAGIDMSLASPALFLGRSAARQSVQVLRSLRGRHQDQVQVVLFLAAVRLELEGCASELTP